MSTEENRQRAIPDSSKLSRVQSALSPEVDDIVTRTIACALRVHKELGPGYVEGFYHDALCIELECEGLRFEREVSITIQYRGRPLRAQPDFLPIVLRDSSCSPWLPLPFAIRLRVGRA